MDSQSGSDPQRTGTSRASTEDAVEGSNMDMDFSASHYETRHLNPGDEIVVHHNQDDNETVLTDLQTVEYEVGQRTLFPSAAAMDMSSSDSDHNRHPSLVPISEEDTKSVSVADSRMPAKIPHKADPNWKSQLDEEIGNLPSRLPNAPPTISNLQYDDQGRASKEQLKNNPQAVARVGAHPQGGSVAAADPNWKRELDFEIQLLPTPIRQAAAPSVNYDNQGRIWKSSAMQDPAIAGRVGAHPQRGRGTACDEEKNSDGEEDDNNSAREEKGDPSNLSQDDGNSPEDEPFWKSEAFLVGMGALILVVIAVAIIVPLVLKTGAGDEGYLPPETLPPSISLSTEGFDLSLVPNLTDSTLMAVEDIDSAQHAAYDWISKDPNWDSYEGWRKQQRFAMACLCFSFVPGSGIRFLSQISYTVHECEWELRFELCPQNDGVVTVIRETTNTQAGRIPPEVVFLSKLESIQFGRKTFTLPLQDMFPEEVVLGLPLLDELLLVDSVLDGTIPSTIGLFASLQHLDLSDNDLTSTIPSQLVLLSNLTSLLLSDNNLSGFIPEELGTLSSLAIVQAEGNPNMEPPVPTGFCGVDRPPWEALQTDWCSSRDECCSRG